MKGTFAVLGLMLVAHALPAQTARTNAPARSPAAVVSPEVHGDRRVTFRLRAPNAGEVRVSGEWPGGAVALRKDTNGVWSATIGPLEPDISSVWRRHLADFMPLLFVERSSILNTQP